MRAAREANASGVGNPFQSRGNIDAVAENVVALNDNVANIDTDTQFDAPLPRFSSIALGHSALNVDSAGNRVNGAAKLHQRAVAHQLDDPAQMGGDLGIDKFAPQRL